MKSSGSTAWQRSSRLESECDGKVRERKITHKANYALVMLMYTAAAAAAAPLTRSIEPSALWR